MQSPERVSKRCGEMSKAVYINSVPLDKAKERFHVRGRAYHVWGPACYSCSLSRIYRATALHQDLPTEPHPTHKKLKLRRLNGKARTLHYLKKLPNLLEVPLQTIFCWGHIKLWVILIIRRAMTHIIYVRAGTVRIREFLQNPADHALIGLRGCFEPHG